MCCCFMSQVKEQKEEAERFQKKLKEMEDLKIESFLVQLFHINKARQGFRNWVGKACTQIGTERAREYHRLRGGGIEAKI